MIKFIETIQFKNGTTETLEKNFQSRKHLKKVLDKSALPGKLCYQISKLGKAVIHYEDRTVHLKVVDKDESK